MRHHLRSSFFLLPLFCFFCVPSEGRAEPSEVPEPQQAMLMLNDSTVVLRLQKEVESGWQNIQLNRSNEKSVALDVGNYRLAIKANQTENREEPTPFVFTIKERRPYFIHVTRTSDLQYVTTWVSPTSFSSEEYEKERLTQLCAASISSPTFLDNNDFADYVKEHCEAAISLGSAEANTWYGLAYERQLPGFSNFDTALRLFKKAHELHHPEGSYHYAVALLERGKVGESELALSILKSAAKKDVPGAKSELVLQLVKNAKTESDWLEVKRASEIAIRSELFTGFYGMARWAMSNKNKKRDLNEAMAWAAGAGFNNAGIVPDHAVRALYDNVAFEMPKENVSSAVKTYANVLKKVTPITGEICLLSHLEPNLIKGKSPELHLNKQLMPWVDFSKPIFIDGLFVKHVGAHQIRVFDEGNLVMNVNVRFNDLGAHSVSVVHNKEAETDEVIINSTSGDVACKAR